MSKFVDVVETVQPTRESREFLHSTTAGVKVPLFQSALIGGAVSSFVLMLGIVFLWIDPWRPALVIGGAAMLGWLFLVLVRWLKLTKPEQPQVQVRSVDHDNNPATPKIIRVQLDSVESNGHYKQTAIFDLPVGITEEQMSELAVGLLEHQRRFSIREWAGPGKTFSDPEFRALQSAMIKHGLVAPKSEKGANRGYQLTDSGVAFLEKFIPSPSDEDE
jgi:hypothetical protein